MTTSRAAMRHAAIETARPGWFVIRNSTAMTWDVPKNTE
jgi:hypothetical protein